MRDDDQKVRYFYCEQVDSAEASGKPAEERAELFAKMIAAFNEAKGSIRRFLSAGE